LSSGDRRLAQSRWREETIAVDFVTGVFATWLLEQLADAGRKRLVTFLLGDEQERAVRVAASRAIELTAEAFYTGGDPRAEHLAMVIDQVFGDPLPVDSTAGQATLLQTLDAGMTAQLAPLEDARLTGADQSSLSLLGVSGGELAEQLAGHLVREIVSRGARGGALAPLANQLNHDVTHLQGQVLEAKIDRLILEVGEALHERHLLVGGSPDRPVTWLGRVVDSWGPLELEVHRPIVIERAPTGIPEYIEREHDQQIRDSLAGKAPRLIVIVGGSSTGKTRAAYEAVKNQLPDWRLHYPIYPDKPRALADSLRSGRIAPQTVIWLNELQQYLLPTGGEETAAALRQCLQGDDQILFIGTTWSEYWQELVKPQAGLEDPHPQARALLLHAAERIDIDPQFPPGELEALADRDPRVRMALQADMGKITQYIAAGPALVEFYTDAKAASPAVWAILSASMDWCLVERYEQYPDTILDFLRTAAVGYMSDEERGSLDESWFTDALQRASVLLRGAARPLTRVRSGKANPGAIRYRLADYLLQYARHCRSGCPVPASFWDGIWAALDSVYVPAFAHAADDRGMYEQSARLWETLAGEGNPVALAALMRNPQADTQAVQETAIEVIRNLDMNDIDIVGWTLFELRDYPDLHNHLLERIAANAQELGVGDPLEMSGVLEDLSEAHRPEAVSLYIHRIGQMIELIDVDDFWSASSLVGKLLESDLEEGRRVGRTFARSIYIRCQTSASELSYLLVVIRSADPELFRDGIKRLRILVDDLYDVRETISITPLIARLRILQETEAHTKLLQRVCSSIGDLALGSSYAPLEMISLLREEGLDSAADELSVRVAAEYDPVLSGAAAHSLKYLRPLMPEDVFEVLANRMANQGPILPVAEAEQLAESFAELRKNALQQTYLQRLQKFRAAEGY
jgi:hypothetical protein